MAAIGRLQTLNMTDFWLNKCLLLGEADIWSGRMSAYHAKADIRLN